MADKTAEQIEEEKQAELRKQAEATANGGKPGIFDAIIGFIKFLFETFFSNSEAPNEQGHEEPDPPSRLTSSVQLLLDTKALPKWQAFQEAHAGGAVTHISPVRGDAQVTSNFGHRHAPTAGASTEHKGLDLGARGDSSIVASADGVVLFSGQKSGYGSTVVIGHADGSYTLYGHMTGAEMPPVGAELKQGEKIGVMGATGTATGVHLHYEQRKGNTAYNPVIGGQTYHEGMLLKAGNPFAGITLPDGLTPLNSGAHVEGANPPTGGKQIAELLSHRH